MLGKVNRAFIAKYQKDIFFVQLHKNEPSKIRVLKGDIINCARNELGFSKNTVDQQIWNRIIKEWIKF